MIIGKAEEEEEEDDDYDSKMWMSSDQPDGNCTLYMVWIRLGGRQ